MPFDNFQRGYEHYQKREYEQASACFMQGLHNDWNCVHWLGHCYEHGYGVEQDLSMAKDLLSSCRDDFGTYLQKKEDPYYQRLCQQPACNCPEKVLRRCVYTSLHIISWADTGKNSISNSSNWEAKKPTYSTRIYGKKANGHTCKFN